MTDISPSNSFKSADEWLDELESELASVCSSPSIDQDVTSELSDSYLETNQPTKSRKSRHRMMQLYLTIAAEDLKGANKKSNDDSKPYYTIVDSNNNNLNNINRAFLKKLDEKEIAQLKKVMLARELSIEPKPENNHNNQVNNSTRTSSTNDKRMLVLCSPINSKTNKLIDSLINQLEEQYTNQYVSKTNLSSENTTQRFSIHTTSKSNSESLAVSSSNETFAFDQMNAKTEQLKSRMIHLKRKYEMLRQKKSFEQDRKKKLFSAHIVSSGASFPKKTTEQQKPNAQERSLKHKNIRGNGRANRKVLDSGDFETRLSKYGVHNNINASKRKSRQVELVERRSASIQINPKSLNQSQINNKQTHKRSNKRVNNRRKKKAKVVSRIPWRG